MKTAMAKRMESTERTILITRGDELARLHDADVLIAALSRRLGLDGFSTLGRLITRSAEKEASGAVARAVFFATALVGRLRVEGRGELADAVVSLLSGGSPEIDPVLWLNEADAFIAMGREVAARNRARGLHESADSTEANAWMYLRATLVERLRADGHDDLAIAIDAACRPPELRERIEESPPVQPPVAAVPHEPPPEQARLRALTEPLVRAHAADVLAYATVTRLRAAGRDLLAASIMMFWAREIAGPMVDPAELAAELLAALRSHGRGALADTIASPLSGASINRDPFEIMMRWLDELSRPMVDSGPLAAALVATLRNERHGELADRVENMLKGPRC